MPSNFVATDGYPHEAIRSLPPTPSLEFERKRAKALLRQIRGNNPDAKLADAQFISARELGFASWPRLVQYFRALEREAASPRRLEGYTLEYYDSDVRSLLAWHRKKADWAGRTLAAFVPRFYGRSIAEVIALPVTTEDARLAIARQNRCSSWDQLLEQSAAERARQSDPWGRHASAFTHAARAIRAHDMDALEVVLEQHSELLHPSEDDARRGHTLVHSALIIERVERTPQARRMTDWLASRGMDLTRALNDMLLGFHGISAAEVRGLLGRGADPNWLPANGVSVLEHSIVRYDNSEAVDLIARRSTPPRALWIAAGLGDVEGVGGYFDRSGKLIAAAYRDRAPFNLRMSTGVASIPDPDDHELLAETALVALLNGRTAVIELLVKRGFPIDYLGWGGTSPMRYAIGQRNVAMVETLLRLGADLDKPGQWPSETPREFARQIVRHFPDSAELRTILELCGAGTPEEALTAFDAQRPSPPPLAEKLQETFAVAGDDAARRGQTEIGVENLFIAFLRQTFVLGFLSSSGVDLERLRDTFADRLLPAADRVSRPPLPFDTEMKALVERAVAIADERRRELVTVIPLFAALIERDGTFTTDAIVECGGDLSRLRDKLARA
jgi:hypothetical protein